MTKQTKNNDNYSITQLRNCARMLACNIMQYREKYKNIPLDSVFILVTDESEKAKNTQIMIEGEKIYKKALAMLEADLNPMETPIERKETRSQPRFDVMSQVLLVDPSSGKKYQGKLSNISWGGVRVLTLEPLGNVGGKLGLLLHDKDGERINIVATIVRSWSSDCEYYAAIRFSKLHQKDESRINDLLKFLIKEEDQSSHLDTRFAQRIDISYWDESGIKETLEDISKGGMILTTSEPMELDKSIQIHLAGTNNAYSFTLRARVVKLTKVEAVNFTNHQVTLKFEHPTQELHSIVNVLINRFSPGAL